MRQIETQTQSVSLGQSLRQLRESAGLNLTQLARFLGAPENLIIEIETDNFSKISSLPYLKGILKKYSRFCQGDYQQLLELAEAQLGLKQSGKDDLLPPNRFKRKYPLFQLNVQPLIIVSLLFGAYLFYQLSFLLLPPRIILFSFPQVSTSSVVLVSGKVWGKTKEFSLNNEKIFLKRGQQFEQSLYLSSGVNLIEFKAVNYLGQETVLKKTVIFQPEP